LNKVFVLLRNEWTKILRKKIVYFILILTVLGIVALGGIFKLFSLSYYSDDQIPYTESKSEMEKELFNIEKEISDLEQHVESIEENNKSDQAQDLLNLHINLANLKHYKLLLELGLAKNINIYSSDFRRQLINDWADLQLTKEAKLAGSPKINEKIHAYDEAIAEKASPEDSNTDKIISEEAINEEAIIDETNSKESETSSDEAVAEGSSLDEGRSLSDFSSEQTDTIHGIIIDNYSIDYYPYDYYPYEKYSDLTVEAIEQKIKKIDQIIEENSYPMFIEYQINNIKSNQALNDQQKDFKISDLELELQVNPLGKTHYPGKNYFLSLQHLRDNSFAAINNGYLSYRPLLPVEIEEARHDFQVANYYLNLPVTDLPTTDASMSFYPGLAINLGTYAIICLIIILAGSTISQEISTGSIKGLIIAPVKRYKIFFAKALSILSISLIGMLIVYLTTLISSYVFVEPFYRLPYAFATQNGVVALQFPVYLLLLSFSKVSFVLITGATALMFSSITRSTSISVGITMVMQFGLLSIYNFIKLISINLHPIIAFLPFEYLDLSKYIFPVMNDTSFSSFIFSGINNSREFVLRTPSTLPYLYWLAMIIGLIWIARDSFVKNDL